MARSSTYPFKKSRPGAPRHNYQRIGMIFSEEEYVIRVEPLFELRETRPVLARHSPRRRAAPHRDLIHRTHISSRFRI
jgi:hypothetical protein